MANRPPPVELHPLLGALDDDGSVQVAYDPADVGLGTPASPPGRVEDVILDDEPYLPPAAYCDHCGYVGGHAHDCPEVTAAQAAHEERLEQLAEEVEQRSSLRYLLRQAAARALRRLARRVAGE